MSAVPGRDEAPKSHVCFAAVNRGTRMSLQGPDYHSDGQHSCRSVGLQCMARNALEGFCAAMSAQP